MYIEIYFYLILQAADIKVLSMASSYGVTSPAHPQIGKECNYNIESKECNYTIQIHPIIRVVNPRHLLDF